jgi:hypothetical protein
MLRIDWQLIEEPAPAVQFGERFREGGLIESKVHANPLSAER